MWCVIGWKKTLALVSSSLVGFTLVPPSQHPNFAPWKHTHLPTHSGNRAGMCGDVCDDKSVTYLSLERAASSCAGSQSTEGEPTCSALSPTHTANTHWHTTHTTSHTHTERERARKREEGEREERDAPVSPPHLAPFISSSPPTQPSWPPPPLPIPSNTHLPPLSSLLARSSIQVGEAEQEQKGDGTKGRMRKGLLSSSSWCTKSGHTTHTHTHMHSSTSHTFKHTCSGSGTRPGQLQSRAEQTGRRRVGRQHPASLLSTGS